MTNRFKFLRQPSFRGIPFKLPEDDSTFGNRIQRDQFPGRAEASHKDMGQDVQAFSLNAIIIGDDFIQQADAFQRALLQSGPGTLVHPHYGEIEVVVMPGVRRNHSLERIGQVSFSITFEKYGAPIYPTPGSDTGFTLSSASSNMLGSALKDFKSRFNISSMPDFVSQDALSRGMSFTSDLKSFFSQAGLFNQVQGLFPEAFDIFNFGSYATSTLSGLAGLTKSKPKPMIGNYTAPSIAPNDKRTMLNTLINAGNISLRDPDASTTANNSVRIENSKAMDNVVQASIVAAAGEVARNTPFESREEALSARNRLSGLINRLRDQSAADGWQETWLASGLLLAALAKDINERVGRLPKTYKIVPSTVRTSLDLSNRLYGDDPSIIFDKADDLVKRNAIRNPGFVPVKPIEVLV